MTHTTRTIIDNRDPLWPGNKNYPAPHRSGKQYKWICECGYMSAGWFHRLGSCVKDWALHKQHEENYSLNDETAPDWDGAVS